MKKLSQLFTAAFVFLMSQLAVAQTTGGSKIQLDATSGSGPLAKVGKLMQEVVDFLGGPGVLFIVFIGCVAAWALWVLTPKSGGAAIGYISRAVAGGVIMFNLVVLFTWLQGL